MTVDTAFLGKVDNIRTNIVKRSIFYKLSTGYPQGGVNVIKVLLDSILAMAILASISYEKPSENP